MRSCFVPGCDKDHKRRNLPQKRPMFVVPKDTHLFTIWAEALPKLRPLKQGDRICHTHFQPHEIQKSFDHVINGQLYQLDRDRTRLHASAVPSRNLPDIEEVLLSRPRLQPRKIPKNCENEAPTEERSHFAVEELIANSYLQPHVEEISTDALQTSAVQKDLGPEVAAAAANEDDIKANFDNLFDDIFEVELPNTLWGIHRCPRRSIIFFTFMDSALCRVTKMLTVDSSGATKVYLAARLMSTHSIGDGDDVPTTEALSFILTQLDDMRICPGVEASAECEVEIKTLVVVEEEEQQLCNNCLENASIEVEIIHDAD